MGQVFAYSLIGYSCQTRTALLLEVSLLYEKGFIFTKVSLSRDLKIEGPFPKLSTLLFQTTVLFKQTVWVSVFAT